MKRRKCKDCGAPIEFPRVGVRGVAVNPNGKPHRCGCDVLDHPKTQRHFGAKEPKHQPSRVPSPRRDPRERWLEKRANKLLKSVGERLGQVGFIEAPKLKKRKRKKKNKMR